MTPSLNVDKPHPIYWELDKIRHKKVSLSLAQVFIQSIHILCISQSLFASLCLSLSPTMKKKSICSFVSSPYDEKKASKILGHNKSSLSYVLFLKSICLQ